MTSREKQREKTYRTVLAVADELFCAKGFADTTIRDIATKAEVSVGTVMAVGDKNALLVQVFDEHIATEHRSRHGEQQSSGDVVTQLVALVQPFVRLFVSRPELARCYGGILASGAQPTALFHQLAPQLIDEFRTCLTGAADPEALAKAAYYAYVGIMFTAPARGMLNEAELLAEITKTFRTMCQELGV